MVRPVSSVKMQLQMPSRLAVKLLVPASALQTQQAAAACYQGLQMA